MSTLSQTPVAVRLAEFVAGLRYEDLPQSVIDGAKDLVLDQLACELIGSTMPWVRPAFDLVRLSAGVKAESTIVNSGFGCLAADAAFVNASYGQACELDDATYGSAGHIGTATIPVAIAVGQKERIDGRRLLVAIVAGYEVMYRLMAAVRPFHRSRGFHSQSIGGPFAGAVAAGKILALDAEQLMHAIAIAGSHACGPLEYDQSGGEVKRIHAGLAARGGIHSALLAKFGLTGPRTIIEGKRGFCAVFADQSDVQRVTRELGASYNIRNAWFKLYPAVGGVQTAISTVSTLVAKHDLRPRDIARIRIGITESALLHCAAIHEPHDAVGAQFSLAYSVALAVVRRSNDLDHYMQPACWNDPDIGNVMQRVEAYADPAALGDKDFMATTTIVLNDGRSLQAVEVYPRGSPMNPASKEQLHTKVKNLSRTVLTDARCEALIRMVRHLEDIDDVGILADALVRDRSSTDPRMAAVAAAGGGQP